MHIGAYRPSQRSSVIDLLIELADHYDTSQRPTPSEVATHLDTTLTAPGSPITLVTAEGSGGCIVGLAALLVMPSIVEAVGTGRLQCQLKELYVTQSSRGTGVGAELLRCSARFAVDRGCGRLDWHVKAANAPGIRFYERHGAHLVADRLSYRVSGDELASLATLRSDA